MQTLIKIDLKTLHMELTLSDLAVLGQTLFFLNMIIDVVKWEFMFQYWNCLYYILLIVYTVCKWFLWNSLFLDEKKTYFDLIRVICFKPPSILRIINLLTTNSAYLLYTVWMYVWERMCVENIVAVLLLSWGWDCFLWSHMHTSFFNELGFTVENCSATHHEGVKHIYIYIYIATVSDILNYISQV